MTRILILGADTVAGRSLAQRFAEHSDVSALWFRTAEPIVGCRVTHLTGTSLATEVAAADVVVFCGDASRSSWDDRFGQFSAERRWLQKCVDAVSATNRRLVYISSDAVFCGPWVFHDDNSRSLAHDPVARTLLKYEDLVASVRDSLIVRTNIVSCDDGSFLRKAVDRLVSQRTVTVDAGTYGTPLSADEFAVSVEQCLSSNLSGYVNVGGAERTTPFHLAVSLASALNVGTNRLQPKASDGQTTERSLRCQRLRTELHRQAPLLKETLESLSALVPEQLEAAVAA
ncbi:MAG: sugar nucleotide-binding protein [Planctomycetaceae bacterium]